MAVYVDDSSIPATVINGRVQHMSQWSHLFADTQDELHEFAARLGLKRSYFQPGRPRGDGSPSPHWHYDVTAGKRQQALRLGAQPVAWRDSPRIMRERDERTARAEAADRADRAAGEAYRAGDHAKAGRLLDEARHLDPSRAALWAEHGARVSEAAGRAAPRRQSAEATTGHLAAGRAAEPDPGGRCPECTTARLLPGRASCQACGMLRAIGRQPTAAQAEAAS